MPYRRLPNTDQARIRALKAVVVKSDMCNMYDLAVSLKTLSAVRSFLRKFDAAQKYYAECYERQAVAGRKHQVHVKNARLFISHFIQVLNLAVIRAEVRVAHKAYYGLDQKNHSLPDLSSEPLLVEWGRRIIQGEEKRLSSGGIPIYNPTIAKVKVHYDIFMDSYEKQKDLQALTARSLDELASMREEADKLILDCWNQIEEKYVSVTPNDKRLDLCRDYGVIYYYRTGEKNKEIECMINLVDSHSHLFLDEFSEDLPDVMHRAVEAGVTHIFMPNIDSTTVESLLKVCYEYSELCYPMIGLHPTSVDNRFEDELESVLHWLNSGNRFVAVGEIGLDLYWDRTYLREQLVSFEKQVEWALEFGLPVVIHSREAFSYIYKVLQPYKNCGLKGIFHSFTGDAEEAAQMLEFPDFMIGINGVVTFKKSTLPQVLADVPLDRIVLETDSPYLTPAPFRGKRNESSYVQYTLRKVAEVFGKSPEETSIMTSRNALKVFGMLK